MKHLVSLSLKYVRRQKLRSLLMFLCITLSVFVLNTFIVYSTSFVRTVYNEAVHERGAWEVEAAGLFNECNNGAARNVSSFEEAVLMAEHHLAVKDLYCLKRPFSHISAERDEDGWQGFYELTFDNGTTLRTLSASQAKTMGNISIVGEIVPDYLSGDIPADSAIVPNWFSDLGYKEGDTLTFTITPMCGQINENGENVRAVREEIARLNAESTTEYRYVRDDYTGEEVPYSNVDAVYEYSLLSYLTDFGNYGYMDLELTDIQYGEPMEISLKIAGFEPYDADIMLPYLGLITSMDSPIDFSKLDPTVNGRRFGDVDSYDYVYMIMNPNRLIDDDMAMLLEDMGFESETAYEEAVNNEQITLNGFVNTVGLRSVSKIGDYSIYIAAYLILALIVWLMARFVIDNAFEISVQERSSQFAALRIMGASRGQLTALVLSEGLFYCLTAVPIGVVASMLMCRSVFNSFKASGFRSCEFHASPLATVIGILLCIAGIIISSYTSAMWASRKLSPAEVLSYGKPKSTKKHIFSRREKPAKQKKSHLKSGSKSFMVRYTFKNIFRTKKRFLISTVAMALGVIMFTFCVQLALFLRKDLTHELKKTEGYDFYIYSYDTDMDDVITQLENSPNFCDVEVGLSTSLDFRDRDSREKLEALPCKSLTEEFSSISDICIGLSSVRRQTYESEGLEQLLGMTYEEFQQTDCLYLRQRIIYFNEEIDADGNNIPQEDSPERFVPMSDLGLGDTLELECERLSEPVKLGGVLYSGTWTTFFASDAYIRRLISESSPTLSSSIDLTLSVTDTQHYDAALAELNKIGSSGSIEVCDEYMGHTGLRSFIKTMIKVMLTFMLSVWLTGIFSMMNTLNTSVLNRSGELLMMRSVGMTKKQLYGNVILESVLFAAFSALIGTAVSMLGFYALVRYASDFQDFHYSGLAITTMAASFAVNVIISLFAAIPGIRTLTRSINQHIS